MPSWPVKVTAVSASALSLMRVGCVSYFVSHYIADLRQQCHILKICDFSGQRFKGFEVHKVSMSTKTTQLLSSGESCKLRYDTTPVKRESANVYFYTNKSKMPNFDL